MATTTEKNNAGTTIGIILVVLIAVIAGAFLMDRNDTGGETRIERAIDEAGESNSLSEGIEEIEGDNDSALERAGDSIGDAVNN